MMEIGQPIALEKLEALLANVDRRAGSATSPSAKARMYNLAGDLCFDAQQPERAAAYYGHAVNTHISADQYDSAVVICKKLIALTPASARLAYAAAWLATTRALVGEVRRRMQKYADAADNAGLGKLARRQRVGLAEMSSAEEVLDAIAQDLARMGNDVSAEWIYGQLNRMNGKPAA